MMKIPLIGTSWKMNKTLAETEDYFHRFLEKANKFRGKIEIFILVPHTVLVLAVGLAKGSGVKVGSQDHFWEDFGSYTGEVSAAMVKDCGAEYAMIGHYERRLYFHETNDDIHRKTKAALKNHLMPIICIGESIQERQSGQTLIAINEQIEIIFKDFSPEEMRKCVILYEPFWAIGSDMPANPTQVQESHRVIRREIVNRFGEQVASTVKILYGGSVQWDNVAEFLIQADVDGVGVGRAGWDPVSFLNILNAVIFDKDLR